MAIKWDYDRVHSPPLPEATESIFEFRVRVQGLLLRDSGLGVGLTGKVLGGPPPSNGDQRA